jgi:hypothetical protein
MSQPPQEPPAAKVRAWFHGLGEVLAFFWAAARALGSLLLGRWPGAETRHAPSPQPPDEGKNKIQCGAPVQVDD